MWLFILLLIPVGVMIVGLFIQKGRITLKEFLVELAVMSALVIAGYFIARHQATADQEIWNGWITYSEFYEEWWERVSCRHPISCSHRDKNGNTKHANDGYYHAYDVDYHPPYWEAHTSNGEKVSIHQSFFESIASRFGNREYVHIFRFSKHRGNGNKYVTKYTPQSEFIPSVVEHGYTNYIKADPGSILRKMGQKEKFTPLLPEYPRVNSELGCLRVLPCGVNLPDLTDWNKGLAAVNARLGKKKQVNILMVVVNTADSSYIHALEEHWLGGKKNDFVIVVGCARHPKMDWVRMMSWSKSEDLKVELREALLDLQTLEKRDEILKTIETKVDAKFVRTPMAEFAYLMAGWQPSPWILAILLFLGIGSAVGLTIYFYQNNPFHERLESRGLGRY